MDKKIKSLAKNLRANLQKKNITIKHTIALELVGASFGLRSRNVALKSETALSPVPSERLREKAVRLLAVHPNWIETCIEETMRLTHPKPTVNVSESGIPLNWEDLENSDYLKETVKSVAEDIYYTAYPSCQNSEWEQKTLNSYLDAALKSFEETGLASTGLFHNIKPEDPQDAWTYSSAPSASKIVRNIAEELADEGHPESAGSYLLNRDELKEIITEKVLSRIVENKDSESTPTDIFNSHERVELVAVLGCSRKQCWDDAYLYMDSDGKLEPNLALKESLRILGLDISDCDFLSDTSQEKHCTPANPMRAEQLVTWENFQQIIEDIGTWAFNLIIYSLVPAREIVLLDNAKAIRLENCILAAYDGTNGRISEISLDRHVILNLDQKTVKLYSGNAFSYSPKSQTAYCSKAYNGSLAAAWPYGTPLPCSKETKDFARKLLADGEKEYNQNSLNLLKHLAQDCEQGNNFFVNIENKDGDDSGISISTTKDNKKTGKYEHAPLNTALLAWLDKLPKKYRVPSSGPGTTSRSETVTLKKESSRILAEILTNENGNIF